MMPQIATRPVANKGLSDAMRASDQLCLGPVSSALYTMPLTPAMALFETVSPTAGRPTAARVGVHHASLRAKITDEIREAFSPARTGNASGPSRAG